MTARARTENTENPLNHLIFHRHFSNSFSRIKKYLLDDERRKIVNRQLTEHKNSSSHPNYVKSYILLFKFMWEILGCASCTRTRDFFNEPRGGSSLGSESQGEFATIL